MRPCNFFTLKSYDCNYQDINDIHQDIKDVIDNNKKLEILLHDEERKNYNDWCSSIFFNLIDNIYSIRYINGNPQQWDLIFRMETNKVGLDYRLYVRIRAGKNHDSEYYGNVYISPKVKTFVDHFFNDRNDQCKIRNLINQSTKDDIDILVTKDVDTVHHHPDFISYEGNFKEAADMWNALKDIPFHYMDKHTDLYWKPEQAREFEINLGLVDRLYFLNPCDKRCSDLNTYAVIRMQRCPKTSMNPLYIVIFMRYGGDDPTQIRYYSRLHFTCNAYWLVSLLDCIDTREQVAVRLRNDGVFQ